MESASSQPSPPAFVPAPPPSATISSATMTVTAATAAAPGSIAPATRDLPVPPRRTTWTLKQNILRVLWSSLARLAWILVPQVRAPLIRVFGGQVGENCRFARNVEIIIPWNLRVGSNVEIGERVWLYSLGLIAIGDNVVIDYKAHLCAGTHDFRDPRFPLLTPSIRIGADTFIGIDAYIAPGVAIGANCRIWPRSSVYKNVPDGALVRGNPARVVAADELRHESHGSHSP